ncbi:MAG: HXXEE domain-containing protein [Clostridiaceae bacterium]
MNSLWIFFSIAITLHNLEEAVWLPRWSQNASRFHKKVETNEFVFAVIVVTLIAYLGTFLFLAYPESWLLKDIYFGLLGMMILNSVFPHLIATVLLRRYMPGLITGIFLMLPVDLILIIRGIQLNLITINEVIISTLLVGGIVLALLPVLFNIGKVLDRQLRN